MSSIQESYQIPSSGEHITLRAMTLQEEKIRLSSNYFIRTLINIINRCIVENNNDLSDLKIDIGNYPLSDLQYLMYKLRIITYGPNYSLKFTCNHCNHPITTQVNLDELKLKLPKTTEPQFDIGPLPVSQDVIQCKLLTSREFLQISEDSESFKQKYPDYEGDPEISYTYAYKMISVNNQRMPSHSLMKYVNEMHAKDALYFDREYGSLTDSGLDLVQTTTCPHCGNSLVYNLPVTEEFWTPSNLL